MTLPVKTARIGLATVLILILLGIGAVPAAAVGDPPAAAAPAALVAPGAPAPNPDPLPAVAPGPTVAKFGLYVTQVFDFDMVKRAFNVTFWAWFLSNNPDYKPLDTVEIVNAKNTTVRFPSTSERNGQIWTQGKYSATVAHDWDVRDFPFDRETFNVVLEEGQMDAQSLKLEVDADNSRIDKSVKVLGWTIEGLTVKAEDSVYDTTFGDPALSGTSTYSRVVATITMKREGLRLLFSLYIGFYVAFILSLLVYLLDLEQMAMPRISLCAGAIFAAVGNKYVIDNSLPATPHFSLSDAIQMSSFLAILMAILLMVIMDYLRMTERTKLARRLNRAALVVTALAYLGFNGWMVARVAA